MRPLSICKSEKGFGINYVDAEGVERIFWDNTAQTTKEAIQNFKDLVAI
jgi:hypothetical protein